MSDHNGLSNMSEENANPAEAQFSSKGKGKAVEATPHDMSMDEDEESSEEEDGEEEVHLRSLLLYPYLQCLPWHFLGARRTR